MTFTAVRTTGIYCRAGCVARPLERNTAPFATRVGAEAAGYRPCLRCRPDRLPEPNLPDTAPPAVAHALVLISEGYLDDHDEEALARAVGYSGRQLRRLFLDHLGATPSFVARSRRAHFARRLLDETDLPVAQVARAAGFAGPRQLHRAVRTHFGFGPSELRRRRRGQDPRPTDGGLRLRIPHRAEVDRAGLVTHLGPRATPGVEAVRGLRYRRTMVSCGAPGLVELDLGAGERAVEITLHLPTFASVIDDVARSRHLLGLDGDDAAGAHLRDDPRLGPHLAEHPGLVVPGCWDRFEALVRIVIGQQVSVAAATTVAGRLAARAGTSFPAGDGDVDVVFPDPERLAEADLDRIGLTGRRIDTIRTIARRVADGSLDLYRYGSLEEIVARYCELPGVGPWTAQVAALRLHRHPDAFPADDLGLRTGAAVVTGRTGALSPAETARLAEPWRPHRAWAAQLLWAVAAKGAAP